MEWRLTTNVYRISAPQVEDNWDVHRFIVCFPHAEKESSTCSNPNLIIDSSAGLIKTYFLMKYTTINCKWNPHLGINMIKKPFNPNVIKCTNSLYDDQMKVNTLMYYTLFTNFYTLPQFYGYRKHTFALYIQSKRPHNLPSVKWCLRDIKLIYNT